MSVPTTFVQYPIGLLNPWRGEQANERVGVLYGKHEPHTDTYHVESILEVPNKADDPVNNAGVVRSDVPDTHEGGVILGFIHTHNAETASDEPSAQDMANLPPGMIGIVFHTILEYGCIFDRTQIIARIHVPTSTIRYELPRHIVRFNAIDPEGLPVTYEADADFLTSYWSCMYGRGCPGIIHPEDKTYAPDIGCCTHGAWFHDDEDAANVAANVVLLTDEDLDEENREWIEKHGWRTPKSKYKFGRTKTFKGGCVFANRTGGSTGKIGCAFVHLAARNNEDHIDRMPSVCWALPLRVYEHADVIRIYGWERHEWYPEGDDIQSIVHGHQWWCVDDPQALTLGTKPVYRSMSRELTKLIGKKAYAVLSGLLDQEIDHDEFRSIPNMPAFIGSDGRPSLPLFVADRKPVR